MKFASDFGSLCMGTAKLCLVSALGRRITEAQRILAGPKAMLINTSKENQQHEIPFFWARSSLVPLCVLPACWSLAFQVSLTQLQSPTRRLNNESWFARCALPGETLLGVGFHFRILRLCTLPHLFSQEHSFPCWTQQDFHNFSEGQGVQSRAYWCLLLLLDASWCLLMLLDAYWCLLMLIDAYWPKWRCQTPIFPGLVFRAFFPLDLPGESLQFYRRLRGLSGQFACHIGAPWVRMEICQRQEASALWMLWLAEGDICLVGKFGAFVFTDFLFFST